MGANGEQAHGDRPVAIGERARLDLFFGLQRFQLAPERNALKQGARGIDARGAIGKGGIHMEVRVHQRRRDQIAACINHLASLCLDRMVRWPRSGHP